MDSLPLCPCGTSLPPNPLHLHRAGAALGILSTQPLLRVVNDITGFCETWLKAEAMGQGERSARHSWQRGRQGEGLATRRASQRLSSKEAVSPTMCNPNPGLCQGLTSADNSPATRSKLYPEVFLTDLAALKKFYKFSRLQCLSPRTVPPS